MTPTDTPRTDAREESIRITSDDSCCAAYIEIDGKEYDGGIVDSDLARQLEVELSVSLKNQVKTQAEVERLKKMVMEAARLGDARASNFKYRAEKAEALLTQIQAFTEAINPTEK